MTSGPAHGARGRNPDHILIIPGVSPFVGRTEAEAREKYDRLTSLILVEDGIALIRQIADENNFTIRQLYQHVASARGHFTVVGTPA